MPSRRLTQAAILEALERAGGYISEAAKLLGTSYHTLWTRISRNPALKEAASDLLERKIDVAESKLMTGINAGNIAAIIFYLKCKAKHRGYVERANPDQSRSRDHLGEVLAAFRMGPAKRGEYVDGQGKR
jgi:hypothetical protein